MVFMHINISVAATMVAQGIISNNQFHCQDFREFSRKTLNAWKSPVNFFPPATHFCITYHSPTPDDVVSWTNYLRYNERENSKCKYFPILKFIVSFSLKASYGFVGAVKRWSRWIMFNGILQVKVWTSEAILSVFPISITFFCSYLQYI